MRFLAHVAIPDHEVLPEGQISPERGERKDQFSDVVKVHFFHELVRAEMASPPHREQAEQREGVEPPAHEEPPAVERALEVQREAHRQIPRQHGPSEREREAEEYRQPTLKRVRRVDLAALLAE